MLDLDTEVVPVRASTAPATGAGPPTPALARAAEWWRGGLVIVLAWAGYALLISGVAWTNTRDLPEPPSWWQIFRFQIVAPATWALLTPGVLAGARRFTFSREGWVRSLAFHLTTAIAVALLVAAAEWWLWPVLREGYAPRYAVIAMQGLVVRLIVYAMIVSAAQAMLHRRRSEEGRAQALELRAQLADERVRVLSLQLEPHFLYNTLHAVSELVHVDAGRADRAIMRLADLLRSTTVLGSRPQIPLRDEVALLRAYAELLHLRWGEGLRIAIEAPDETLDLAVPPLLLQPLVENAVRHGIGGRDRGEIHVKARRAAAELIVEVDDDGAGLREAAPPEGLGLRNTRLRLQHLHGPEGRLELGRSPMGGVRVLIRLPAMRMLVAEGRAEAPA